MSSWLPLLDASTSLLEVLAFYNFVRMLFNGEGVYYNKDMLKLAEEKQGAYNWK